MSPTLTVEKMGTSASLVARERNRVIERNVKNQLEYDDRLTRVEINNRENVLKLETTLFNLKEELKSTKAELEICQQKLNKEQKKNMSLTYCDLPIAIMRDNIDDFKLTRLYDMVTVARCDLVNFSSLASALPPTHTVSLINHLQAIIDTAFIEEEIFVMERYNSGCIAVSGLVEEHPMQEPNTRKGTADSGRYSSTRTNTPFSFADSTLYNDGSESGLSYRTKTPQPYKPTEDTTYTQTNHTHYGSSYASILATAVLRLMSLSSQINIPECKQVQLRVAMHSGPCSAGIVNMQTASGTLRAAQYKLFGQVMHDTARLASSGLALQIRVSKQTHKLLLDAGGFMFERCPDFPSVSSSTTGKTVESYWLVGADHFNSPLPSLEDAIPLSDYDELL